MNGSHRTARNVTFFLCLSLLTAFFLTHATFCGAVPHDEYKKIQKEIRTHKKKLEAVRRRESSVLTDIELANRRLHAAENALRKNRAKLVDIETKIRKVEKDIARDKENVEKYREWIKRKLRVIYKYGTNPDVALLFMNANDISRVMRTGKYLQYIARYEEGLLRNYKNSIEDLSGQEEQLVSLKAELIKNRKKVKSEEESLAERKRKKEVLLASVKKEKYLYMNMLRELEAASKRILEIIRESEKKEREREESFAGKDFSVLKGKLPWPVRGKVAIRYGSQRDPQFNTPIFRSGTYIESSADSYVKAVHEGRVVFAEWFKGYGELVIVNHGEGYHTLYGSLSEIFPRVGDIIKESQPVGRVGNSGILDSPGLYFEVRYKGKPLDPLQWLRRR